jgi:two-component system, LytTR family, response regulator
MRVMIAEDEPAARRKLARLLNAELGIVLIAEVDNGDHALELATTHRPEVCFLDIQMPGLSGLEVAMQISSFSLVVFITAFSEHATKAFDLNAVDYLLKPYTRERLHATLERVRKRVSSEIPALQQRRLQLTLASINSANAQHSDLRFFALRENGTTKPIQLNSVRLIEADDNYCRLHFDSETSLQRITLTAFLDRANTETSTKFVRIHRSRAVNLQHVGNVTSLANGDALIVLKSGEEVRLSRRYRQEFLAQLGR